MRKTGSVTQIDIPLSDNDQLVSATTAKGVITDVNEDFCRLAGFTKEELLGQAHNIVRHPDMPQAAFKLMWDTIQQGKPWRGIVKNRCKNGNHYWVDAYVTPAFEDDKIIGFESVRQKALPEWIKRAEDIYGNLNRGKPALPWQCRLIEKNSLWIASLCFGLVSAFPIVLFAGAAGLWLGPLILILSLVGPNVLSNDKKIDQLLSEYNSDELTQYIYTGHVGRFTRLELLRAFHSRHLHTVLERMDQQGEELKKMSSHNAAVAGKQFTAIATEREQMNNVTSAVQKMNQSVQEIARSSESSAASTDEANDITLQGLNDLNKAVAQIDDLVNTMDGTYDVVNKLAADSEEIRSIIGVISGIAEQTNLLALNAAIEAARAGEQGRGFAVVADEVRSLASKTQDSTETVAAIINSLIGATEETVSSIRAGTEISRRSKESMTEVKTSITNLAGSIKNINTNTKVIADLSGQQAVESDRISDNSEAVLNLTEQLAESAQESLHFSDLLTEQANKQAELARRFRR